MSDELKHDSQKSDATLVSTQAIHDLNEESLLLIQQIVAETDEQKSQELTHLFNNNQNKKTMARVDKLSKLLDTITDQALARFTAKPDEISNKELFDGLKIVQDLIERGQKQVSGVEQVPLIQLNQQNNEVNLGNATGTLNRDSRERVKSAVLGLLASLQNQTSISDKDIVETDAIEEVNEQENSDG